MVLISLVELNSCLLISVVLIYDQKGQQNEIITYS